MLKMCSKCKIEKLLDEFYKLKRGRYGVRAICKACFRANYEHYRKANPEKVKALQKTYLDKRNSQKKKRFLKNPALKLNSNISRGIRYSLKNGKEGAHWEDMVGYTKNDLIEHLKTTIQSPYTWDDFIGGKIKFHIDHKIPIRAFNYVSPKNPDFLRCWALENLQLIPAQENLIKGSRIKKHFQPNLLLRQKQQHNNSDNGCKGETQHVWKS